MEIRYKLAKLAYKHGKYKRAMLLLKAKHSCDCGCAETKNCTCGSECNCGCEG